MISGLEKLSEIAKSFENLETLDVDLTGTLFPNFLAEIDDNRRETAQMQRDIKG